MDVKIGQFLIAPIVAGIIVLLQTKFNVEEKWLWIIEAVLMVGAYMAANLLPETATPQAELILGAISVFLMSAGLLKATVAAAGIKVTIVKDDAELGEVQCNVFTYRHYGEALVGASILVGLNMLFPFLWPITAIGVGAGWWAVFKNG